MENVRYRLFSLKIKLVAQRVRRDNGKTLKSHLVCLGDCGMMARRDVEVEVNDLPHLIHKPSLRVAVQIRRIRMRRMHGCDAAVRVEQLMLRSKRMCLWARPRKFPA